MATYKNMDICMPVLKRRWETERDPARRTALKIAINIIAALPAQEISEGTLCRDCFWYAADGHTCLHKNGLRGKVRSEMFCSYGSKANGDAEGDRLDADFSEFDEALNG